MDFVLYILYETKFISMAVRNVTKVKFGLKPLMQTLYESGVCVMESYRCGLYC